MLGLENKDFKPRKLYLMLERKTIKFPINDINAKYLSQFVLSYRFGKKSASRLCR